MEETERKVALDFRQPLDATYWRRVSAVSIFLAPVIAAAYAVSIHEQCHDRTAWPSASMQCMSRAARLVLTEVFVIGLFAAVSPHEPTGSAKMVALACMVTGVLFSLLAAFDRWSQPSSSEGEHAIRVGIPSAIFFLWLWLLYGFYWRQSCAAWEGFRLCAAATNCMRLVGVLLLRFAVSPAVTSYPPGQLPFESACACNLLLMLVPAALTPPNRMRLALASGLQTVRLSQLQPDHGALAQPPERHPGMVAASAQAKDKGRRSSFDVASQSGQSSQSHDSLGAELPGLNLLPLGFEANAGLRYRTPNAGARSHASSNSQKMPLPSQEVEGRLARLAFVPVDDLRAASSTSSERLVQRTAGLQIGSPASEAGQQAPMASTRAFFGDSPNFSIRCFRPHTLAGRFAALIWPTCHQASPPPPAPCPAPQSGQVWDWLRSPASPLPITSHQPPTDRPRPVPHGCRTQESGQAPRASHEFVTSHRPAQPTATVTG